MRARVSEGYATPAQLARYQALLRGLPDLHAAVRAGDLGADAADEAEEARAGVHGVLDAFHLGGAARTPSPLSLCCCARRGRRTSPSVCVCVLVARSASRAGCRQQARSSGARLRACLQVTSFGNSRSSKPVLCTCHRCAHECAVADLCHATLMQA